MQLPNGKTVPWNGVHDLVCARAESHGAAERVEVDGVRCSWQELDRLSDSLAATLHQQGIQPGDNIATMMHNRIEQLIVWFATSKLGAVWVPFNTSLVGNDLAYTLRDAAPKIMFTESSLKDKFTGSEIEQSLPGIVSTVDDNRGSSVSFQSLLQSAGRFPSNGDLTDPAVIIYTGGTTGRPKGVVLSQFSFIAAGFRYCEALSVRPDDRHYSVLSLCHVGGTMNGIMGPLIADIPVTMERRFSGSRFWPRAKEFGATIVDPVSTMITVLCQAPISASDRNHPVRIMPKTTAQLPPAVVEHFVHRFRIPMVNLYSLSEAGGIMLLYNEPDSPKPDANGHPNAWAEYEVVDETDQFLPPNQIGEIVLRPKVPSTFMLRYHNDPERTVQTWRNLWLHTGDLGRVDEDGYLYFVGRQAHWLRTRGENVSCFEVESVISQCPGVAEVAVVGVPAELGEEDVKAFIVPEDNAVITHLQIVAWCQKRLSSFKVPRYIEFVSDLPRSAVKQEIERHKLRTQSNESAWDSRSKRG
jgi:crotonobetaine/carnitine-CoA ligase